MAAVRSLRNAVEENNSIAGVPELAEIISNSMSAPGLNYGTYFCEQYGRDNVYMSAPGLNDGTYFLGGQKVHVKDDKAVMADGTIWGLVSHKSILHDEVCANYSAL